MTPRRNWLSLPLAFLMPSPRKSTCATSWPVVAAQGADVGDQPAIADQHLDLAADLAGHRHRRVGVVLERASLAASTQTCEPDPAISTTLPMPAGETALAGRCGGFGFLGEVADFIEEFTKVRPIVHALPAPWVLSLSMA